MRCGHFQNIGLAHSLLAYDLMDRIQPFSHAAHRVLQAGQLVEALDSVTPEELRDTL